MKPKKTQLSPSSEVVSVVLFWERPIFIAALLVLATVAVYWPVGRFDFFNYDDPAYFSENYRVLNGLSWRNFLWAFQTTDISSWYPLMWLSFMLDVTLFGRGAAGPHLVNLFLHVANTVLLFLLLRRLTGALWRSAIVAALFALHPLRVESVAWIAERKDVLSTFFGFLSLIFYARYAQSKAMGNRPAASRPSPLAYGLSLTFFTLGLLSKPMLVTLPCVMLLLDYWPLGRLPALDAPKPKHKTRNLKPVVKKLWLLLREKIPFFLLGFVFALVTLNVHRASGAISTLSAFPLQLRIENAFVSYARYLGKTFWPFGLAVPYPHPGKWPLALVVFSVLLVLALSAVALWQARRRPYVFVGWFWFVGMLFLVIGIIQWGIQSMADRFTYVPLIGFFIALAWGAEEAWRRWRLPGWVAGVLAVLILVALSWRAADQLWYWRDSESLFRHALDVTKNNEVAYSNLGTTFAAQKKHDLAISYYRKALSLNPNSGETLGNLAVALAEKKQFSEAEAAFQASVYFLPNKALPRLNYGNVLLDQGRVDQAVAELQQAVRIEPENPKAHSDLGHALSRQRRYAEAIQEFAATIRLKPDYAEAHNNWGLALADQKMFVEAIPHYQSALKLDPNMIEVHNNLGGALLGLGRLDEAMEQFRLLLKLMPNHDRALDNVGVVFASQGKFDEAIPKFQEAIRLAPKIAGTHYNLANTFIMQEKYDEAIREYRETIRLDPQHAQAHCNLGSALADSGRRDEAIEELREALRLNPGLPQAVERLRELDVPPGR